MDMCWILHLVVVGIAWFWLNGFMCWLLIVMQTR
jgi:hypothetical protein